MLERVRAVNRTDRSIWLIRIYYLLFIGGDGFLVFLNLFYIRLGLSGEQIGLLALISSVITLGIAPLIGLVSSNFGQPHKYLRFGFLGSSVLMLLLSQQAVFGWIALIIGLNTLLISGAEPISSNLVMQITDNGRRSGYGSIRLWGALGWASIALLAGWLIEHFSMLSAFWGYSITMLLSGLILSLIHTDFVQSMPVRDVVKIIPAIKSVARDKPLIGLGLMLLVNWTARLGIIQFEPLYMDQLGASETLIGLAATLGALVEIPCMLLADSLLKKWSTARLITISIVLDIFRVGVLLVVPAISSILFVRVIDGVAYAFLDVAMVLFISQRAPAGQNATFQAIYWVMLPNVIRIVAAPLIGRIFDIEGAYMLYQVAFVGGVISLVIFILTNWRQIPQKHST